jgi:glycerol-3-phosphate dehydrogenase (NAD(P)+)
MEQVAVIGSGSWGTALAVHLALVGHDVMLWARDPALAAEMTTRRANPVYLADITFPASLRCASSLDHALARAGVVVVAVPSHGVRAVARQMASRMVPGALVVSATKGIEEGSLLRMSEVLAVELPTAGRWPCCRARPSRSNWPGASRRQWWWRPRRHGRSSRSRQSSARRRCGCMERPT